MSRIEPDQSPQLYPQTSVAGLLPVLPLISEDELETPPLPREHPRWVQDAVAVSQRARALIARMRPIALRILTFWEHQVRSVLVGGRRLEVDPSGSYRME